ECDHPGRADDPLSQPPHPLTASHHVTAFLLYGACPTHDAPGRRLGVAYDLSIVTCAAHLALTRSKGPGWAGSRTLFEGIDGCMDGACTACHRRPAGRRGRAGRCWIWSRRSSAVQ